MRISYITLCKSKRVLKWFCVILLLCIENPRKFYKKFLNIYKEFISNNESYKIYLNVSDNVKDQFDLEDSNIYYLENKKSKVK